MNAPLTPSTDERRWTLGAWLTLALAVGYLLICVAYTLVALRQPSDGWFSDYTAPTGWVVVANQGGSDVLRVGDRINAIVGANVDIVLGPRYAPPTGWSVGGSARYTVVRDGRVIELDVLLVQKPDRELLRFFQGNSTILGLLLSMIIAFGVFLLRPGNIVARLLLLVLAIFFGSQGTYFATWSPAMFFFPPLLHTFSLIITPWLLIFAMIAHLSLSFPLRAWPITRWPQLVPGLLYGAATLGLLALVMSSMTIYFVFFLSLVIALFAALIGAPFYHLRTARDFTTRAQIGWVTLGLVASFGGLMLGSVGAVLAPELKPFLSWLSPIGFVLLPICIGIAILRYRLFDIDIIIRRTLVYSVLTLALGATYFISVVAFQTLFVRLTGQESALAIVGSTLAIASLFGPLRRWVQRVIDRRFFRRKYDARLVLEQFALRAQQQSDLDALGADILGVVQDTLEPERVTLWLRDP